MKIRRFRTLLTGLLLPILIVLIWEILAIRLQNPSILPRVEKVANRFLHPFSNILGTGSLAFNLVVSIFRVFCGFLFASAIAIPLGLLMGKIRFCRDFFNPLIEMMRQLCPIAWIPFALAVFKTYSVSSFLGLRYTATIFDHIQIGMIFVLFWGGFFPILLNTIHGVVNVKNIYIEVAHTLGATNQQIFSKVVLPAALPSIVTGLRVGLGISWFVIIAAEMMPGSDAGIGYLIMHAYDLAEMDVIICGMILIGIVGALLSKGLESIFNQIPSWQAKEK